MTSSELLDLLRQKHSKDVFVEECKDGDSLRSHRRLDAWVMARSWAKPLVTGYEIKVSRSDYARDAKWHEYLGLCNQFFFVTPAGLLNRDEIPAEVGLVEASKNGTRLFTRRKAAHREVVVPESLYRYVLMWRSKITRERANDPVERWQRWLAEAEKRKTIGYEVGSKIARIAQKTAEENAILRRRIGELEAIEKRLVELGLRKGAALYELEFRARSIAGAFAPQIISDVEALEKSLARFLDKFEAAVARPTSETGVAEMITD